MNDTCAALDRAVTALATGSDQTQSQSVQALVSILPPIRTPCGTASLTPTGRPCRRRG
ncbi:hypothetical protein [Streptomyces sp. NPDC059072]|uniref:hypothetical protein n=1 Tax=Streptomyces sp. NPDC059072 TaxID=3346715 RepID=UPI0036970E79